MTTELIKINPVEFGLTDETASNISAQFKPMLDKMVELEAEFNSVVAMPIEDEKTASAAKELRLKYVRVRTGTEKIHKEQKEFYLKGGRFVDGWKNAQLFASQGKENRLSEIENYRENIEKKRREKIKSERIDRIKLYVENFSDYDFANMADDVFEALFDAKVKAYNDRIEAERKAEEERILKLKEEEEERKRIRLENERLKSEREALEKKHAEEKAKAEKLKAEIMKREKDEKERIAAALKQEEMLRKQPIKKQLKVWVDSFSAPQTEINNAVSQNILNKFNAFKSWAINEIENL